jgi:hypothetical protein
MADEHTKPISVPAFIRSMLDPFIAIHHPDGGSDTKIRNHLEPTFLPDHAKPNDAQLLAIGKVCATWAVLERIVGMLISRLCMAPEYPTLAILRELSANNQIKALRILIPLHKERYARMMTNEDFIIDLMKMPARLQTLKDKRNEIAHTVWHKWNETEMLAMRSRPVTYSVAAAEPAEKNKTSIESMNSLSEEIQEVADRLFLMVQLLPAVNEQQQAQFLARATESLHRELLPERSPPQEPPETKD